MDRIVRPLTPPAARLATLTLAAAALAACLGCGVENRPIGRLETAPRELALGYPQHRTLPVRLRPTSYPIAGGCPTIFVHLVDSEGHIARTFDYRPPAWTLGEEVSYDLTLYQSALAEPLPAGSYRLLAGAYSPGLGLHHVLERAGEAARRLEIGRVTVGAAMPSLELGFSGGWLEPEAGTDSQVLARRWFRHRATLTLHDASARAPVELWLLLNLPSATPSDELVLASGERRPRLEVAVSCAPAGAELGPGRRQLRLTLPAAGLRQGCSIELAANYALRIPVYPEPRTGSLEAVSWNVGQNR
jgi:hypothetical protein